MISSEDRLKQAIQTIVEQSQLGRTPQQIVDDFDGVLTLAQVYDALSYYHEHEKEIEQYITENREALWKGPDVALMQTGGIDQ